MNSLTQSVRTVKTPRIPRSDEEEDCAADLAVFASATDRPTVTIPDSGCVSPETAHFLAYGNVDAERCRNPRWHRIIAFSHELHLLDSVDQVRDDAGFIHGWIDLERSK